MSSVYSVFMLHIIDLAIYVKKMQCNTFYYAVLTYLGIRNQETLVSDFHATQHGVVKNLPATQLKSGTIL